MTRWLVVIALVAATLAGLTGCGDPKGPSGGYINAPAYAAAHHQIA